VRAVAIPFKGRVLHILQAQDIYHHIIP